MELTQQQLATAIAHELAREGARQSRLSAYAGHPLWTAFAAVDITVSDEAEHHVVVTSEVAQDGSIRDSSPSGSIVALLETLSNQTPTIVERVASAGARARRIFTPLGVLEASDEGLVIVELAPGICATDLQRFSEPTLKISAAVVEMVPNEPKQ